MSNTSFAFSLSSTTIFCTFQNISVVLAEFFTSFTYNDRNHHVKIHSSTSLLYSMKAKAAYTISRFLSLFSNISKLQFHQQFSITIQTLHYVRCSSGIAPGIFNFQMLVNDFDLSSDIVP